MFTGIIEEVGVLKERITAEITYKLVIEADRVLDDISKGNSIAVNGVCLTVVDYTDSNFTADVMPETLSATNLNNLKTDSPVNLERAVRANGLLGGHFVTGHVDGIGQVTRITVERNAHIVEIDVKPELTDYLVTRGSVAVNGISLTIMDVRNNVFTISLIPETRRNTNLKKLKTGDILNVETDLIGKYVFKMLKREEQEKHSVINKDLLHENGFL